MTIKIMLELELEPSWTNAEGALDHYATMLSAEPGVAFVRWGELVRWTGPMPARLRAAIDNLEKLIAWCAGRTQKPAETYASPGADA